MSRNLAAIPATHFDVMGKFALPAEDIEI